MPARPPPGGSGGRRDRPELHRLLEHPRSPEAVRAPDRTRTRDLRLGNPRRGV